MRLLPCAIVLAVFAFLPGVYSATDKIFCYFGSWSVYRNGNGKFDVEDINPHLCTHVIYTFIGVNQQTGQVNILDAWNEVDKGALKRFTQLKSVNPKLKVMVAMGGYNEGSTRYSAIAASPTLRSALVESVIKFMSTYGFDGFDLDWEYPAMRGGSPADKVNFIALLKLFRERFDPLGYILTAAVGVSNDHISNAYDVPNMAKYLHFINLMAYDLHGPWDQVTGQNAPLYASSKESSAFAQLNVDAVVKNWIQKGAPSQSLVLGIPLYGRSYQLSSARNAALGAPTVGGGTAGKYTQESGTLSYLEICETLSAGGWTTTWDDEQRVPIAVKDNQWIGYDNAVSVRNKSDYAMGKGLGGVMVWSLEQEDSRGVCGEGKNPLMTAIREGLKLSTDTTASTGTSTTTAPVQTTTAGSGSTGFQCTALGNYRDPADCNAFYVCQNAGNGKFISTKMKCSPGLYFDDRAKLCNWPALVSGC